MLSNNGVLRVAIADPGITETDFDLVEVAGDAVLGGVLEVLLTGGFEPASGDTFEILTAASVSGEFDSYDLPTPSGGLNWYVNYGATSVELVSTYAADFNEDGVVDEADMAAWESGFGSTAVGHQGGDADADSLASGLDFLSWQRQFVGPVVKPLAAGFVPEPTSLMLTCLGLLAGGAWRRR